MRGDPTDGAGQVTCQAGSVADPVRYRERLTVPVRWWLLAALAVATLWLVVAVPAGDVAGAVVATTAAVLLVTFFLRYGGATVEVDAEMLRAGRATIERAYLGQVEALTGEAVRAAFGRDCDPKAYLLLRSYARGAVRVEVTDPEDPTPYWLLATRHPVRSLAQRLGAEEHGHGVAPVARVGLGTARRAPGCPGSTDRITRSTISSASERGPSLVEALRTAMAQ